MIHRRPDGFTLIELLTVVAIMGLMGTLSVGGYRAMRRGMEERGVLRNASQFIRNAHQRAVIDRQPTAVFFWNEVRQDESDDGATPLIVVGRAVAVRVSGRVTAITGDCIYDEFGDLAYMVGRKYKDDGTSEYDQDQAEQGAMTYIYRMSEEGSWDDCKAIASQTTVETDLGGTLQPLMTCGANEQNRSMNVYGYYLEDGVGDWKVGDTYGFEIASMTLPNNYIFGTKFKKNMKIKDGPEDAGEKVWFYPPPNDTEEGRVTISALRPGKSGDLEAVSLAEKTESVKE